METTIFFYGFLLGMVAVVLIELGIRALAHRLAYH